MSDRIVYTATMPDGSQLMVERFLDDDGNEVAVNAATKPPSEGWGVSVWSPPIPLTRE